MSVGLSQLRGDRNDVIPVAAVFQRYRARPPPNLFKSPPRNHIEAMREKKIYQHLVQRKHNQLRGTGIYEAQLMLQKQALELQKLSMMPPDQIPVDKLGQLQGIKDREQQLKKNREALSLEVASRRRQLGVDYGPHPLSDQQMQHKERLANESTYKTDYAAAMGLYNEMKTNFEISNIRQLRRLGEGGTVRPTGRQVAEQAKKMHMAFPGSDIDIPHSEVAYYGDPHPVSTKMNSDGQQMSRAELERYRRERKDPDEREKRVRSDFQYLSTRAEVANRTPQELEKFRRETVRDERVRTANRPTAGLSAMDTLTALMGGSRMTPRAVPGLEEDTGAPAQAPSTSSGNRSGFGSFFGRLRGRSGAPVADVSFRPATFDPDRRPAMELEEAIETQGAEFERFRQTGETAATPAAVPEEAPMQVGAAVETEEREFDAFRRVGGEVDMRQDEDLVVPASSVAGSSTDPLPPARLEHQATMYDMAVNTQVSNTGTGIHTAEPKRSPHKKATKRASLLRLGIQPTRQEWVSRALSR